MMKQYYRQLLTAKHTKSKSRRQITELAAESVNISVFWGKNTGNVGEVFVSQAFLLLGTPAFALKEIFRIIHHSRLFVWVLSLVRFAIELSQVEIQS